MITKADLIVIENAAALCHSNQYRADGKTPYITHPRNVARLVRKWGGSNLAVAAALSHDILEDCSFAAVDLWHRALLDMTQMDAQDRADLIAVVQALTKDATLSPRVIRIEDMTCRVLNGPPEALLVKIVDRLDNVETITDKPRFAPTYIAESKTLLEAITPKAKALHYYVPLHELTLAIERTDRVVRIASTTPRKEGPRA